MSRHHKNKTRSENSAVREESASNITSIRTGSNKEARSSEPAHAEQIIRRRAYELYVKRGREDGHAEEDWLRAEAEVLGSVLRKANVA